jgi:hypothetical protein
MNPKEFSAARPDLDVAMFDFAAEHKQDPERALYRLQFLLLDEDTCLARVAFLRAMAAARKPPSPSVRERTESFHDEIGLLCEEGLFAAQAAGCLTPEQVHRLQRLTCNADALLAAHHRLVGEVTTPMEDEAGITHGSAGVTDQTAGGFTSLVASRNWSKLSKRLQPYLPEMLRIARLPPALADDLQQFLVDRAHSVSLQGRRFGEILPEWLTEFAQTHGAPLARPVMREDWEAILESWSVRTVLETVPAGEPDWAREFRQLALRLGVVSGQDLLGMALPEPYDRVPALPMFRRDLLSQMQQEREEALRFFELN